MTKYRIKKVTTPVETRYILQWRKWWTWWVSYCDPYDGSVTKFHSEAAAREKVRHLKWMKGVHKTEVTYIRDI